MLSIAATAPLSFGGFAKAAAPKAAPKFAYGLPGNFNAVGGARSPFAHFGNHARARKASSLARPAASHALTS